MYQDYKKQLNQDAARIFEMLEKLEKNERLSGTVIKRRTSFNQRRLTAAIEDIRIKHLPVISIKAGRNSGYKIAATEEELEDYIAISNKTIQTQKNTLDSMAIFFKNLKQKRGERDNG